MAIEQNEIVIEELAKQSYKEEKYSQALKYYTFLLEIERSNPLLYVGQGNCFRKLKFFHAAFKFFQQALYIDISCLEAQIGQCLTYINMESYRDAWNIYKSLSDKYVDNPSLYNISGQMSLLQGNPTAALEAFENAICFAGGDDNVAGYYYNKGLTLCALNAYSKAIDAFDEAIKRNPQKSKFWQAIRKVPLKYRIEKAAQYYAKGEQHLNNNFYDVASLMFNNALKFDDTFILGYVGRGKILLVTENNGIALESFNYALSLNREHELALIGKGDALLALQRYREAIQVYEKVIQLNTKLVQAYIGKGNALFALNSYKEAIQDYEKALELGTKDIKVYPKIADCYYTVSMFEKALLYYKQFVLNSTQEPYIYLRVGEIEFSQRHFEQAFVAYKQAENLGIKGVQIYLRMGDCLKVTGQLGAISYYEQGLTLAKQIQDAKILYSLAHISQLLTRPAQVQFDLLYLLLLSSDTNVFTVEAYREVASYYEQLSRSGAISADKLVEYTHKLRKLVDRFPPVYSGDFLFAATGGDPFRLARLLISFAPDLPVGLNTCVRNLLQQWIFSSENAEFAEQLYAILPLYDISKEEQNVFYARLLCSQSRYEEAEPLLARLVQDPHLSPDILWLYVETIEYCNRPRWLQIEVLTRLTSLTPLDEQLVKSWIRVGDFCSDCEGKGLEAILAYVEAEKLGATVASLQAFRHGMWDAIPALRTISDYHFPVVVSLDLECDYNPQAAPGSTIFEVGAVRGKGMTELERYHAIVRRESMPAKVAHLIAEAKDIAVVMQELREFIGTDIVVGHNIRAFDSVQLRGVGLDLPDEQVLDTLEFARLLYPDSIHHNLGFLCEQLGCQFDEQHNALPDARACANLLHKLGDELVCRSDALIAGFRAFITPDGAFDRAILRPRNIAANPAINWKLDPAPLPVHQLTPVYAAQAPASPSMVQALQARQDALIERYDPRAAYIEHIPVDRKTLVLAGNRQRLERMLLAAKSRDDAYVLPHPQTLLCPQRVTQRIEQQHENSMKLLLFCLYQASHNHDAQTLYPCRLPADELRELREMLLADCCGQDSVHTHSCKVHSEAHRTIDNVQLLIATHDNFIQYQKSPEQYVQGNNRELLIVDNLDELQMHFVDYAGEYVDSDASRLQELTIGEHEALQRFTEEIVTFAHRYIDVPKYHERILLSVLKQWLQDNPQLQDALSYLEASGPVGKTMVQQIRTFIDECTQRVQQEQQGLYVKVYWLDLWFEASEHEAEKQQSEMKLSRWRFCKLDCDIPQKFEQYFLRGFTQRILCGDALSLGSFETTFIRRFFRLDEHRFSFVQDTLPPKKLLIPDEKTIRPSSFLNRYAWARDVGSFLNRWMLGKQESLVVTLYEMQIAQAFAEAWDTLSKENHNVFSNQVLSSHLKWSSTKIAERLAMHDHKTLTFLSPTSRRNFLDTSVHVEAIGPLRFMNRRDPVVAAMMRAFAPDISENAGESDSKLSQLHTYLLPQAMLELKMRLASPADTIILLDSALYSSVYRDEVLSLLPQGQIESLPYTKPEQANRFDEILKNALERHGYGQRAEVSDKELHLVLETVWGSKEFKRYEREDGSYIEQKEIIRNVFAGKDQLVVVATGGGKSLCFQLPAILKAEDVVPTVTLVISPLIALMQDQVQNLNRKGIFSAIMLNSQLSPSERSAHLAGIRSGDYSIIYMAPEQVHSSALRKVLEKRSIGLIAIDEAHCVSGWGHDFRPEYSVLRHWIANTIYEGRSRTAPIIALTATARSSNADETAQSTVKDIIDLLDLRMVESEALIASPQRPELCLSVKNVSLFCSRCNKLLMFHAQPNFMYCSSCGTVVNDYKDMLWNAKLNELVKLLDDRGENGLRSRWDRAGTAYQRGIIYCRTTKETEKLAEAIAGRISDLERKVVAYHGKMNESERKKISSNFVVDDEQGIRLVVATNAFGMGIDAARLGYVIHFDVPATPENYYQEVGRAGRNFKDDEKAQCILLYNDADIEDQRWLVSGEPITKQDIKRVYEELCKLREQRGHDTFLVTESQFALQADVDVGQVKTLLYYLEFHTAVHKKPVIEGGEYAAHTWHVRFAQDYQERERKDRFLGEEAHNLLRLLESFHLSAQEEMPLDIEKLEQEVERQKADGMVYAVRSVEEELRLLIKRGFLIRTNGRPGSIALHEGQTIATLKDTLKQVELDVHKFLDKLVTSPQFNRGHSIDTNAIIKKLFIDSVPAHIFVQFLFLLSQEMSIEHNKKCRVFDTFKRDIYQSSKQHRERYKVRLDQSCIGTQERRDVVKALFEQLYNTVRRLAILKLDDGEEHSIDPFQITHTYEEGSRLHECLLRLEKLGLLTYTNNLLFDGTRYITLLRPTGSNGKVARTEDLAIDLDALHQQESYKQKKLQLMKDYAHIVDDTERLRFLNEYFMGKQPLMTPYHIPDELTKEQREAVESSVQHQLVVGEAGSGKTKVLLERIKYLIYEKRIPTNRIIVFTHLNNAINRITHNIKAQQLEGEDKQQFPEMLTLNSFAARIFRKNYQKLMRPDGQPYYTESIKLFNGEAQKKDELFYVSYAIGMVVVNANEYEQLVHSIGFDIAKFRRMYTEVTHEKVIAKYKEAIDYFRQQAIFPGFLPSKGEIEYAVKSKGFQERDVSCYYAVYCAYLKILGEYSYYTYDEQILFAYALLKQYPNVRHNYSYDYIMVDELQDLTSAQIKLLQLLVQPYVSIFAAGDSEQSIINNEGQEISCKDKFLQVISSGSRKRYILTTNFRMTPEIHELASAVRSQTKYIPGLSLQFDPDALPIALPARTGFKPDYIHSSYIPVNALKAQLKSALRYYRKYFSHIKSVAFIVAYSEWMRDCKAYFKQEGCQFVVLENTKQYQTRKMKNLLVHLRLIQNKERDDDIEELIGYCLPWDLSRDVIEHIRAYASLKEISMWDALEILTHNGDIKLEAEYAECLCAHIEIVKRFSEKSQARDVVNKLQRIQEQFSEEDEEYDEEEEQSESFERQVNKWNRYTVEEVLQEVKRHIPIVEDVEKYEEKYNPFILTTCDHAKSQDFDTVFIIGADHIKQRERLYVNISRAKKRLILVTNDELSLDFLKGVPKSLYRFDYL